MPLLYLKALHIIGFVTWFAGLFYLVRLFIYHSEAFDKSETERQILHTQFSLMEKRLLYIITYPGMVLTLVFGIWMIAKLPGYFDTWLYLKLGFVVALVGYHFICQKIMNDLQNQKPSWTSRRLRLWNELATLLLVSIVFLAVLKNTIDFVYGTIGFFVIGILLAFAIRLYAKSNNTNE
jgi:putative membrane protein